VDIEAKDGCVITQMISLSHDLIDVATKRLDECAGAASKTTAGVTMVEIAYAIKVLVESMYCLKLCMEDEDPSEAIWWFLDARSKITNVRSVLERMRD